MRFFIFSLFISAAVLLSSCNPKNKKTETRIQADKHVDTDDHDNEKGSNHSEDDGHDHSKKSGGHSHTDGGEHTGEISFTKEQAQAIGLSIETVTPADFRQVIKTGGQVQASLGDEATVVATANGIVSFANPSLTQGASVRAGETIVTVSARKLPDGDPGSRTRIAFETAEKEFQRAENLVKDQIISTKEFEQVRSRYETAKTVYEAQASNFSPSGVRVTTPIGGFVKTMLVAQGDYVSVGQPIVTVSQNRRLQLRAEVPEHYFGTLRNIHSANFRTSYNKTIYSLASLNGKLLSFGKSAGQQSFYIPVTFEFDNVGDIIPGAFAEVYLLSNLQSNVISVPVSALTEEQTLYFVYLQLEDEVFKKQEVTIGPNNGERVQILAGLSPGDKVVTNGVYQVKLAATASVMPEGHSH